ADFLDRGGSVRSFVHGIARALQCFAQHGAQLVLIFHKEKRFHLSCFYHESGDSSAGTRSRCVVKGSNQLGQGVKRETRSTKLEFRTSSFLYRISTKLPSP